MKTNLLIQAALMICTAQATLAAEKQEMSAKAPGYELAPQLGFTSFSIAGSGMESRGGAIAGVGVLAPTSVDGLKVETGLNILETGAKSGGFLASAEYQISSLAIPVMAHYTFSNNEEKGRTWYARAGGILTQTMSAKSKVQFWGLEAEDDVKDSVASNDLFLTVGLGGATRVFEDYRWTYDLSYGQGSVDTIKGQSGKSSGLIASTSLVIPL